ncbi:MAG: DNA recombination protein RmuC [Dehalogenimonas sp.]|uniref:DNA recombination protein RmuC n=1 Tax=Candidatus Dehalogenimonas loeffleri TaxID=3127115 RepID=A0ABZ2J996_9CHLR|nr:DNA recombination protein RmuC [Dehalogenimonas sp.]
MEYVLVFALGLAAGSAIVFFVTKNQQVKGERLKNDIVNSFDSISLAALKSNSEEFLKLANETLSKQTKTGEKELETKKQLIDQTYDNMKKEFEKVGKMITDFDKESAKRLTSLDTNLKAATENTLKLHETTGKLQIALANSKVRGQWGDRIADDILRLTGFIEGVNYDKQLTNDGSGTRPDYTFRLPQDLKLNMDVKFPFDNYLAYLAAETDIEKDKHKSSFLKDVRQRINEVAKKEDYINVNKNTVDYALVFIPNEQVYCFINENDHRLLDDSLRNKVILCSPMTLYAILVVIRQAVDNFNMEKTASRILALLGTFNTQWHKFKDSMDRMGKKIDDAQNEFQSLVTTRQKALERPLAQIETLRKEKQIVEETLPEPALEIEESV